MPYSPAPIDRRVGQVGVHVAAREAVLDVERRAVADEPEAGRPVVAAPDDVDRRPRQRGVALVRVDVRGDEDRQLARQRHHPGHEPGERVATCRTAGFAFGSWVSDVVAVLVPDAHVEMAGRAGPGVVRLGHERDAPAVEVGDLLRAVLEEHAPVGRLEDVVVADVDLVLAGRRLALAELDRDPRLGHLVAQEPVERLGLRRLEQVVVLVVVAEPLGRARSPCSADLLPRVLEDVVLELGAGLDA